MRELARPDGDQRSPFLLLSLQNRSPYFWRALLHGTLRWPPPDRR